MARSLRSASPRETADAVVAWVHDTLEYRKGVTHVHTAAFEALDEKSGVCQDFAHIALSVLRENGIPARYVSGYLHPDTEAGIGIQVDGESHAWVEVWLGDWWGVDPTVGAEIGNWHVVVARGRDYGDVAPVRGIYAGGGLHEATVSVKITRVS
jgi:transglutaminase-like putative cysteine protease